MATPSPGRRWVFPAAVALLLLLLPLAAWLFLRAPVQVPAPRVVAVEAPPVEVHALYLGEQEGSVEVRNPDGTWRAAIAGEALPPATRIRTGDFGRAVLGSGERYEVQLESGTEVSVEELTSSISRLLLERGMATADVQGGRHVFEVSTRGSDAVARTSAGRFTVSNDMQGTVAVAATRGEVELRGGGKLVVVRAGQQSLILRGEGPTEPAPIPESLLLKVQWPKARELTRRRLVVAGKAEPGSQVHVDGTPLQVGADGTFRSEVQLREGDNKVQVRARGVGGGRVESTHEVRVDTTPPKVGLDRDLWTR